MLENISIKPEEEKTARYVYRIIESPLIDNSLQDQRQNWRDFLREKIGGDPWHFLKEANPWLYEQMRDKVDIRIFSQFIAEVEKKELEVGDNYLNRFVGIQGELQQWFIDNDHLTREEKDDYLEKYRAEIYAITRLASAKSINKKHYPTQVDAGLLNDDGFDTEVPTGEGKTLAESLPAIMASLEGKGVHIATSNEYLARRDVKENGPLFEALRLKVSFVGKNECVIYDSRVPSLFRRCSRKEAYEADITYGKLTQFAFDLEADKRAVRISERVRRYGKNGELIIPALFKDEFDSAEILESNKPLITKQKPDPKSREGEKITLEEDRIADKGERKIIEYSDRIAKEIGEQNVDGVLFQIVERNNVKSIEVSEQGWEKVYNFVEHDGNYDFDDIGARFFNALKANYLFEEMVDYYVDQENKTIVLVDAVTNRLIPSNRLSFGIHQALEAKHGLPIREETGIISRTTAERYDSMHEKSAGTTGTISANLERELRLLGRTVMRMPKRIWVDYLFGTRNGEKVQDQDKLVMIERYREDNPEIIERFYLSKVLALQVTNPNFNEDDFDWSQAYFERTDYPTRFHYDNERRISAIVDRIIEMHDAGRPVIVFTNTILQAKIIEKELAERQVDRGDEEKIKPRMLTALPDEAKNERYVVATAGFRNLVTIATNMAARGTDYQLRGDLASDVIVENLLEKAVQDFDSDQNTSHLFIKNVFIALELQLSILRSGDRKIEEKLTSQEKTQLIEMLDRINLEMIYFSRIQGQFRAFPIKDVKKLVNYFLFTRKELLEKQGFYNFDSDALALRLRWDITNTLRKAIQGKEFDATYLKIFSMENLEGKSVVDRLREELESEIRKIYGLSETDDFPDFEEEMKLVLRRGGIHAIICHDVDEENIASLESTTGQAKGRVPRSGQPGSCEEFYAFEDYGKIIGEMTGSFYQKYINRLYQYFESRYGFLLEDKDDEELKIIFESDPKIRDGFFEFLANQERIKGDLDVESRKRIRERNQFFSKIMGVLYKLRNFILSASDQELINYGQALEKKRIAQLASGNNYLVLPEMKIENFQIESFETELPLTRNDCLSQIDLLVVYMLEVEENISELANLQSDPLVYYKIELDKIFQKELIELARRLPL